MTHHLMQKTPNEFKWDLWNARIISVGFYTFVTLKWLPHFNAMKSMKKVHTDMHYSDTVLNFDNTLLLKMGKNTTDTVRSSLK